MSRRFNRWGFVLLALLGLGVGLLLYQPARYFPSTWRLRKDTFSSSSWILDRKGRLLYEIIDPHKGAHRPVSLEEIPIVLQWAVIATEDASFYRNPGLDVLAMLRALWMNLREGRIVSGGSTITQQLVRNVLLSPEERTEKSLWRKAKEVLGAFALTKSMSKEEILELYLNETYFGNMAYGVDAAARAYFAKPVSQLDLAESALLAGLPQSPAAYNPLTHFAKAKARQKVVLELMVKAGYISPEEAEMAYQEPLHLASAPFKIEAPHFCMMVREQAAQLLGEGALRRGGLRIYTTLDLDLQHAAEAHVRRHLRMLNEPRPSEPGHNVHNAAVVVLDVHNGAVRALVGSPDYFDERIDGAVNAALAPRQPGSAIKPLTYAAAFERGYSPATVFADVRSLFLTREGRPYVPVNYDYQYHGHVSLRQALACSYNVVAVKLLDRLGLDALLAMARRLGITTLGHSEEYGLALTLGGGEVQLLQLTAAYAAFANSGWRVAPYCIERIEDAEGRVLYQHAPVRQRAPDPRIAYLIT
ncbi:MAG: transglycosylase domain-containing protein, partial [Anaerolineae bacterium]|nr:transglycosylase domain-containing protein [Anaerolineae bacterium]